MTYKILYESSDFLAVDKPAGLLTIPGRNSLESNKSKDSKCLWRDLEQQLNSKLWVIHRLDFEVSGLILFAKNAEAHRTISGLFEKREIQKYYEAWTEMPPSFQDHYRWESSLLRGKKRAYESPVGKNSITLGNITSRTVITFLGAEILVLQWQIQPLTGRSHQIRYHLSKNGFPILGDELYGSKTPFLIKSSGSEAAHTGDNVYTSQAIALRAVKLIFPSTNVNQRLKLPSQIEASSLTLDYENSHRSTRP